MIEVIKEHLSQNRRLVVPQLGAFIVKEPDPSLRAERSDPAAGGGQEIIFSELLKRDDGILRELLMHKRGIGSLEAAGAIDRFVFEVRHALEHTGSYRIHGFGHMNLSPSGAILFHHEPHHTDAPVEPTAPTEEEQIVIPNVQSTEESPADDRHCERSEAEPIQHSTFDIQHSNISPSAKRHPEPYVKGLQYGRPQKNMQGYSYVGAKPRRGVDKFVVIAIVVAVLAIAAIVYGYFRRSQIEQAERSYTEQTTPPAQ